MCQRLHLKLQGIYKLYFFVCNAFWTRVVLGCGKKMTATSPDITGECKKTVKIFLKYTWLYCSTTWHLELTGISEFNMQQNIENCSRNSFNLTRKGKHEFPFFLKNLAAGKLKNTVAFFIWIYDKIILSKNSNIAFKNNIVYKNNNHL